MSVTAYIGMAVGVVILIKVLASLFQSPQAKAKRRMEKAVKNLAKAGANSPNQKAFYTVLKENHGSKKLKTPAAPPREIAVIRYEGADDEGFPHRCDYCGNPLYISDKACSGCGAPRK